ncbi:MAG: exodeoxyribonuclease VII small subunit [Chloroflexi bacterium]|nr:exodeoxyribonuclease VII small subunit [Chloroflexota bacterium]MCY3581185.1 exodeoxyribonuclease VII small subunit [Chloroflexota bacterium]MCY3716783.1 exodeoxyribonuclease VII small subunit [Chloroflexota bacterium]MDE2649150.1 exodeoxyribonuclease VII small subunit [Chloroflexota bacterium]MXV92516.1 exodeoxyribonuclease VII small subunit [Chloroflexota bacterium]
MTDDIKQLSYEAAFQELQDLVAQLEGGEKTLAESVALYERGRRLSDHCQRLLEEAQLTVRQVDAAALFD